MEAVSICITAKAVDKLGPERAAYVSLADAHNLAHS